MPRTLNIGTLLIILILSVAFFVSAAIFISFFEQIPLEGTSLAIDWKRLWTAVEGGTVRYDHARNILNPPWNVLLIMPLGLLSLRASWGILSLVTIAVLVASVPRVRKHWRYMLAVLLLVTSYPSLRHMVDGNFEALIISGTLLIVAGYKQRHALMLAVGILLATAKPQEVILILLALLLYALPHLTTERFWWRAASVVALVVVPAFLWRGQAWLGVMFALSERGSIMDMSLMAALNRPGFIPSPIIGILWLCFLLLNLYLIWRTRPSLSREKAGALIAASLLISPYAAANSMLAVLAVGIMPLFLSRPLLGILLIALINVQFFWGRDLLFYWSAYYNTGLMLFVWAVLMWQVMHGQSAETKRGSPSATSSHIIS